MKVTLKPLIALFALASYASAEEWNFGPGEGNRIRLEVAKTGVMKGKVHVFEFPAFSAKADTKTASVEISLESQKIQVKDDWVKAGDLKKIAEFTLTEMLDAAKYPAIRYKSSSVVKTGDTYKATGELSIRDKTQNVDVTFKESAPGVIEGNAEVDMRRFGLKPASAMLGAIGTDPLMKLSFRLKKN
jgi:polyisoprenoid-binding protein YceI